MPYAYSLKSLALTSSALCLIGGMALADQVILDDLIVDGSICAGMDCVNGESFGFDTIRLKENNLRIRAVDTSSTSSFPSRDWQITFNDSANGGANKFSIDDIDGGRTPFTLEAGAPSHSLYVDDGGRLGLGTSTPVVDVHVKSGNTPTLRLEQDGSSGFTPQTWDVAGNEAGFFIRDATNGSTLPFRIMLTAPSSALVIDADGDVGIGAGTAVSAALHIKRTTDAGFILEQTGASPVAWEFRNQASSGRLNIGVKDGNTPLKIDESAANNLVKLGIDGDADVVVVTGDLSISGQCDEVDGACADYVFGPDHVRLTLPELRTFITENQHLPNVPSEAAMRENGVNMAHITGRLLEKIEELALYTLEQEDVIRQLEARLVLIEDQG